MLIPNKHGYLTLSDATDAYHLSLDVADIIEAVEGRYNQAEWGKQGDDLHLIDGQNIMPVCKTVACRAGWYNMAVDDMLCNKPGTYIDGRAEQLLGFDKPTGSIEEDDAFQRDIYRLFSGAALHHENEHLRDPIADQWNLPPKGSLEYAKLGAAGLRAFAERWKARLLDTPVRPRS